MRFEVRRLDLRHPEETGAGHGPARLIEGRGRPGPEPGSPVNDRLEAIEVHVVGPRAAHATWTWAPVLTLMIARVPLKALRVMNEAARMKRLLRIISCLPKRPGFIAGGGIRSSPADGGHPARGVETSCVRIFPRSRGPFGRTGRSSGIESAAGLC